LGGGISVHVASSGDAFKTPARFAGIKHGRVGEKEAVSLFSLEIVGQPLARWVDRCQQRQLLPSFKYMKSRWKVVRKK
jgi:hypothetical protein